jgi:hypothetical protein
MKEARPHTSNMHPDMATTNRGSILPAERAERAWPPGRGGRKGRNAFQQPADFEPGDQGCIGGGNAWNSNDLDGDFDAGPWGDSGMDGAPDKEGNWNP